MHYISTRGGGNPKTFSEILLEGLAPDGGLYVPEEYPRYSAEELSRARTLRYPELAYSVLSRFADDIPPGDLYDMIAKTYTKETFGSDDIVPMRELEPGFFLLDLSEGPTLAFKDIALQLLGRLFEYVLKKEGATLNILGATSGDTGSAAEYAMRGRSGVRVFMLSPHGRMSEFQRKQMYTLQDENIFNIAVRGTFDDCQDIVKEINADTAFKKEFRLGAVNSINWARIAAQIVYYFWGYFRATDAKAAMSRRGLDIAAEVSFSTPTGNFGDILAGYVAKRMGLPIKTLVLATNENNVLEEFFTTGRYRPRRGLEVAATSSPSMDISKASNFERYIFDAVGRNTSRMKTLWSELEKNGSFELLQKQTDFVAGSSTHADRLAMIRMIHEKYGVIIDPHTADGVASGLRHRESGVPLICLETALPAKFADTIREAIGKEPPVPESFKKLTSFPETFEIFDPNDEGIKEFIRKHVRKISRRSP